jgi:hypothetical protein
LKNLVLVLALLATGTGLAHSQAMPATSRAGDLQLGGGYTSANSDYLPNRMAGFALYGTFDLAEHYGIEAGFHQVNQGQGGLVYERTYELGARYLRHYGRFAPYAKLMVGRGVFNFPADCRDKNTNYPVSCSSPTVNPATTGASANLAYNMFAPGVGLDIAVHRRINVRADFEYQNWLGFPPNGLKPTLLTIGVAYHFGSGKLSLNQ